MVRFFEVLDSSSFCFLAISSRYMPISVCGHGMGSRSTYQLLSSSTDITKQGSEVDRPQVSTEASLLQLLTSESLQVISVQLKLIDEAIGRLVLELGREALEIGLLHTIVEPEMEPGSDLIDASGQEWHEVNKGLVGQDLDERDIIDRDLVFGHIGQVLAEVL